MKKFYFTLLFINCSLFVFAQVTTPTGPSAEVGITEGQLSVSLTGGANYAIPIAVPPGINGVVPQVSLAYNSQGGNGVAGYGWNISGVSAITRIPRTQFHDGVVGGVNLDINDRFALDGQRLIVKSGTTGIYGANGTIYETESFSNIKITSIGTYLSGKIYGPSYFKVEYPDGSIAYYGYSTDSRSKGKWGITYWENAQKVRISYTYLLANNNLSIEYIKYGNTSTLAPINQIKFVYIPRQRLEQWYVGGESFLTDTILSVIQVSGNSVGFRNYFLTPEKTSLGYERIKSITEKSGDNTKSYNPTVFSYETNSNSNLFSINPNNPQLTQGDLTSRNASTLVADFDGEGANDFIVYTKLGTNAYKSFWVYNNVTNDLNFATYNAIGDFKDIFISSYLKGDLINGYKLSPFKGWTVVKKTDVDYTFTTYSLVAGFFGQNYSNIEYSKTVSFPTVNFMTDCFIYKSTVFPKKTISGDFNGDGLTDVIAIDTPLISNCFLQNTINSQKVYFVDLKKDTPVLSTSIGTTTEIVTDATKVEVVDYNSDGKSDFMILTEGKVTVYSLDAMNNLIILATYNDVGIKVDKPCLLGDYNGDGKTDFCIPQTEGVDDWFFYNATGKVSGTNPPFDKIQKVIGAAYLVNKSVETFVNNEWHQRKIDIIEYNYMSNDINGDGKTDILRLVNYTFDHYDFWTTSYGRQVYDYSVYNADQGKPISSYLTLTSNYDFSGGYFYDSEDFSISGIHTYPIPLITNHTQPNQKLEFSLLTDNTIYTFNCTKDNRLDTRLTSITTGNGVKDKITYKPLIRNIYTFISDYTPNEYSNTLYPNIDIVAEPSFQIVTMLEKQSATVYKKQLFKYHGATSNLEGLGFLGFKAILKTNWHDDNTQIISNITKNDMTLRGAAIQNASIINLMPPFIIIDNLTSPDYITNNINTYNLVNGVFENPLQTNKVFKLKLTQSKQTNSLDNTSAETTTEFDSYNNPLTSTTLLKENETTVQTTVSTIAYKPVVTTLPYLIGIPASKTESVAVGDEVMTNEELYIYASNLLTQINKKGTDTPYIIEKNTYSTYGSITFKVITATGISRNNIYVYDTSKRFITKTTDAKGVITNYIYNQNNGLLESETNHYGQTTGYQYDSWFKRTITTDYLGKTNTLAYIRQNEKTLITSKGGDDESYSEELYDDLGRKIRTGIKDMHGAISFIDYKYDIYDRNFSVSEPYTTTPSQWNTSYYDLYGRPTAVANFTGKTIGMQYNGLTTTTTDSSTGNTKTTIKNAMGNVTQMTEAPIGGIVNYSYYPNGNLKETDYSGTKTTITQDGWGRKTELVDPSAGNYSYTYNDIGEIVTETTPNGTTTYTYDARGNVTKKVILGNNTSNNTVYTFNATTRLLTKSVFTDVADANKKITILYTYDTQGRLITTSETTGYGAVFTKTVSYDAWGRADIETNTASLAGKTSTTSTQNTYKNGFAYQIKDYPNTKTLWETSEVNARGQLTKAKLGNGIEINNSYDAYGYIIKTKHDLLTNNILEFDTDFNTQRGNLNWRKNSLFPSNYYQEGESYSYIPTENFGYDSQDRLISYPDTQGNPVDQTYEEDGRIKTNTLGTYNYTDTTKRYQNTSITLDPEDASYYANREGIFSDGMEGGKNWPIEQNSRITYDLTQKHFGSTSLHLDNTYSEPGQTLQINSNVWTAIDNAVATQYTISAWVLSKENAVPRMSIATDVASGLTTTVKNQWVRIEATYLVPANVKKLSLSIGNFGDGNLWFDDVLIRKTSNTPLVNLQVPDATYKDRQLAIDYNTFKSPVNISEAAVDKLSFTYNENNDRSMMFYGSLDATKTLRPLRKYYSADGSMEIKATFAPGNTTTPIAVEFVTYIGGDGYSAPVVVKSDGITQNYLYLHRDYQGSIIAITDGDGVVLEKRQFDAWGSLIQLEQNGFLSPLPSGGAGGGLVLLLDRGYTGHEHLQSVGLINMNGRLYDPKLHRFLQPDNFVQDPNNTQNYNRYSYVLNNPLSYTDPSGEQSTPYDFCGGKCPNGENQPYPGPNFNGALYDWLENEKGGDGWLGKNFSARNIDEAGTAVGKAFRDAGNWIGRGLGSIFGGGGASAPRLNSSANNASVSASQGGGFSSLDINNKTFVLNRPPNIVSFKPQMTEFGMGAFEWVEGGAALKLVNIAKESTLASKTIVIGEDMLNRVIPFAEKNGFKYFKPRGTNPANWMKNQTKWIYRQIKDPTVRIIDIGSKELEATSKYYMKELEMLRKYLGY